MTPELDRLLRMLDDPRFAERRSYPARLGSRRPVGGRIGSPGDASGSAQPWRVARGVSPNRRR